MARGGSATSTRLRPAREDVRPSEAELVIIDPRPYMTYQPLHPEVAAGSIEARHTAVSLRAHLTPHADHRRRRDRRSSHADEDGHGATCRRPRLRRRLRHHRGHRRRRHPPLPDPRVPTRCDRHEARRGGRRDPRPPARGVRPGRPCCHPGPSGNRLLTVAFVGGGFTGVEGFGELLVAGDRRCCSVTPS